MVLSFWITLVFAVTEVLATPFTCKVSYRNLVKSPYDSTVELELPVNKEVIELFTTTDGTIAPLLGWRIPSYIKNHPAAKGRSSSEIRKLSWDVFDSKTKLRLVNKLKYKLLEGGKFKGLRVRPKLNLYFARRTEFNGKVYPAGWHEVDVSENFRDGVEWITGALVPTFEIHFRSPQKAGIVTRDAWQLLKSRKIPRRPQHNHIVFKLPKGDPTEDTALVSDYYRRTNLVAEMIKAVEFRGKVNQVWGSPQFFSSMNEDDLVHAVKVIEGSQKDKKLSYGKGGYVAVRPIGFYDDPELFGFEFRWISKQLENLPGGEKQGWEIYERLLNGVQDSLVNQKYGVTRSDIGSWMANNQAHSDIENLIASTWYKKPVKELLSQADPKVLATLKGREKQITKLHAENHLLATIIFDWSNDPLLYKDQKFLKKVKEEQIKAVRQIYVQYANPHETLRSFLVNSGLYERFLNSVVSPEI